jgi:hypothetical protein
MTYAHYLHSIHHFGAYAHIPECRRKVKHSVILAGHKMSRYRCREINESRGIFGVGAAIAETERISLLPSSSFTICAAMSARAAIFLYPSPVVIARRQMVTKCARIKAAADPGSGFFQGCLAKSEGSTPEERRLWRDGIYDQIREVMPLQGQGNLSIERMCELTRVSRASFYRSFHQQQPVEEEQEVRSAIQQIAIEHRRRYGYRRISAELRRRGMQVNHKRVMRIMGEDNLLAV